MSSFLDRWMYRDNHHVHNTGMKNGNTGSRYTTTSNVGSHGMYAPGYTAGATLAGDKTTPNLRNVPWAYYTETNTSRRGSNTSTSSDSSME